MIVEAPAWLTPEQQEARRIAQSLVEYCEAHRITVCGGVYFSDPDCDGGENCRCGSSIFGCGNTVSAAEMAIALLRKFTGDRVEVTVEDPAVVSPFVAREVTA